MVLLHVFVPTFPSVLNASFVDLSGRIYEVIQSTQRRDTDIIGAHLHTAQSLAFDFCCLSMASATILR